MRNLWSVLLFIVAILPLASFAQSIPVNGTIIDSATREPIAFVSVTVKESKRGGLTDIDGHFSLKNVPANAILVINYIGYQLRQVSVPTNTNESFIIAILRKTEALEDVVVKSELNPAHRIIRLMQENKKRNDPLELSSYQYNAYTVAALGATPFLYNFISSRVPKTVTKPQKELSPSRKKKDSIALAEMRATARRFRGNYLFVTESYTERIFKHPKLNKETILATKVSGFKDPLFAVSSSNFQPFGFYLDYLRLSGKVYTSPVINGSISLYKFNLRQVIPHERDTTYVITYQPLPGKNFDGVKGTLYINSNGWAIENVIAESADSRGAMLGFRLQQKYEFVSGHWFPVQLNTYIEQKDAIKDSAMFYWDTRSYIKNIAIEKPLKRSDFSDVTFEFAPKAGTRTDSQWQEMRVDSLSKREKGTYQAYDSLPKKLLNQFNNINKFGEMGALQAIPAGWVDLPFRRLISGLNPYEKIRLGLGIQTNTNFSKWFSVGGYAGYGMGDKAWKYGANLELMFNRRTQTTLHLFYSQDLKEPGIIEYFKDNGIIFSNQSLRNLYTSRLDSVREYKAIFTTKPWPTLQADVWIANQERNPARFQYSFDLAASNKYITRYTNTEIGLGLRYTEGETYSRIGRGKVINRPARTQIIAQLAKGLSGTFNGQLNYTKLALQINHSFRTIALGRTSFQAEFGQIWGKVPYAYLFNTKGSIGETADRAPGFFINNSFQTVGVYEFTSDRIASLFIQQNFSSLLFKPKSPVSRPQILLVQNIGYGSIGNTSLHQGIILQAPEKGLFETGLMVRDLLRANMKFFYYGIGFGLFHRYGYYSLPDTKKNWALKFGITVSF